MRLFRETLWFKKGFLDTEQREPADLLPLEDRYLDDGSITIEDRAQFSLGSLPPQRRARRKPRLIVNSTMRRTTQ